MILYLPLKSCIIKGFNASGPVALTHVQNDQRSNLNKLYNTLCIRIFIKTFSETQNRSRIYGIFKFGSF